MTDLTLTFAQADDFQQWLPHWLAYQTFYKVQLPEEVTHTTWERFLDPMVPVHCLMAKNGDKVVGFAHFVFHHTTWSRQASCYLEDLFVDSASRGQQVGKRLIERLHEEARKMNCEKVYWHTQNHNHTAQRLYNWIAEQTEMIQYRMAI
jgi:GNAT superfamily N-acetyltransferase